MFGGLEPRTAGTHLYRATRPGDHQPLPLPPSLPANQEVQEE